MTRYCCVALIVIVASCRSPEPPSVGTVKGLPPESPFLFSEIPLEGTLEELRRVYRRREETAGRGQQLDEAYAVARACLEAALDEAHAPGSSLVLPGSSGARSNGASAPRDAEEPPDSFSSEAASGSA